MTYSHKNINNFFSNPSRKFPYNLSPLWKKKYSKKYISYWYLDGVKFIFCWDVRQFEDFQIKNFFKKSPKFRQENLYIEITAISIWIFCNIFALMPCRCENEIRWSLHHHEKFTTKDGINIKILNMSSEIIHHYLSKIQNLINYIIV